MSGFEVRQEQSRCGFKRLPSLAEGYAALDRGDWDSAASFFRDALAREATPEGLEGLGMAAELLNDEATVFEAREAAHEIYRQRGDRLGTGRIAVWLAVDSFTFRGELAVANGWMQRALTLLDGLEQAPEHGFLSVVCAEKALLADNNGEEARQYAAQAVAIARSTGDASLEAYALGVEGIALVTIGQVQEGMSKLDEAATACLAGDAKEPWVISSVLCYMMDACDRVRDWDRAREWFGHVSRYASRWNDSILYAHCRPHYAVVLTWRGAWDEAENELQLSIEDMTAFRKPMAVEGIVRLAELRICQGRLAEAATLFDQVKQGPLAQLGQAALALERMDAAAALDFVERCLRRLPRNDRLERLPALELYSGLYRCRRLRAHKAGFTRA